MYCWYDSYSSLTENRLQDQFCVSPHPQHICLFTNIASKRVTPAALTWKETHESLETWFLGKSSKDGANQGHANCRGQDQAVRVQLTSHIFVSPDTVVQSPASRYVCASGNTTIKSFFTFPIFFSSISLSMYSKAMGLYLSKR